MRKLLTLLLAWCLLGFGNAMAETPLLDDRGVVISASAPQQVVSLYGSYADAWLLAGGALAGVTDDAIQERHLALPEDVCIVGTTKIPNLELIVSLEPDLVLLSMDIAAQMQACDALEALGIACAAFRVDTWQDYDRMMNIFTQLTGRQDLYDAQLPPMAAQIQSILARAAEKAPPSVLLIRAYSSGAKAKGADNLAGYILQDLGCDNIADRHEALLEELSLEAIVAENPDFIFVTIMGGDEEAALAALDASVGQNPAWQALDAVRQGRLYVLDKELFHYKPNARWGESYETLFKILYGE